MRAFNLLQVGCKNIRDTEYFICFKSCINVFPCLNLSAQNFVLANCSLSPAVLLSALSFCSWFCKSFSNNLLLTILFHLTSIKVYFYFQKSEHFFLIDRFLVKVPSCSWTFSLNAFALFWHYCKYSVSLCLPPTNRMLWAKMTTRSCVKVFTTNQMQPHFRSI